LYEDGAWNPKCLEVLGEGRIGLDVEEDSSLRQEICGSTWLCVQVGGKSLGENMDRSDDLVMIGFADIAVLYKQILRIPREVRSHQDTKGRGAIVLERSWGVLRVPEPSEIMAIELDMFCGNGECIVLRVGGIDGNLCGLDLADHVKRSIILADAEGDGKLATTGIRMDCEGGVTRGDEDRAFGREPGRPKFRTSFQVCEDANDLREVALSRVGIAGTCHDDSELGLEAED